MFWISIIILILSNLFWIYQAIDNAVSMSYYRDSCEDYQSDMVELKRILDTKKTKEAAINFLEQYKVTYDSLSKGEEFIIHLNSFYMTFDKNGQLKSSETL